MRFRTTAWLLLVVLLLGALIFLHERRGLSTRERKERARLALRINPATTTYLRLETTNLVAECVRDGEQWMLIRPIRARAEAGLVERILYALQNLGRGETITAQQMQGVGVSPEMYGFQPPRYRLTTGDQLRRRTVLVGRDAPLGEQVYIREESRPDILAVDKRWLDLLPEGADELRDRTLLAGRPEQVQRLEIRRGSGMIQVARPVRGAPWQIQQPVSARASPSAVQKLLEALFLLRAERFVEGNPADLAAFGFDEPRLRIALVREGAPGEAAVLVGDAVDRSTNAFYALCRPEDTLCVVSAEGLKSLVTGLEDLRDLRLMTMEPQDIRQVVVREGERSLVLQQQQDGKWSLAEPRIWRADESTVRGLLLAWTGAAIAGFPEATTNLAAVGLAPPSWTLAFSNRRSEASAPPGAGTNRVAAEDVIVEIGAPGRTTATRWARVLPEGAVYEISTNGIGWISLDPLFYRDRGILVLNPDEIARLSMTRGGREWAVERGSDGLFQAMDPEQGPVHQEAVQALMRVLQDLHAEQFLTAGQGDLAALGLEPPGAVLTIGLRGTAALAKTLWLGNETASGGCYGLLQGQELIFTLPADVADSLQRPWYGAPPSHRQHDEGHGD